jgi:hypothetical protein
MSQIYKQVLILVFIPTSAVLASFSAMAQDDEWTPVTGADTLKEFMSGRSMDRDLIGGGVARAEYFADGTGLLKASGAEFARTWEIKGDTQICIHALQETACYEFESNATKADLYRARNVDTRQLTEFRVEEASAVVQTSPKDIDAKGGAATPSAEEIAAELSNPNTPLGTLNTNFDYITYDGDLPGASDQSAFKITLQPSLPYPLGGGTNFFVRPAIPIIIDQPVPEAGGGFESKGVELGDIGFDASLGFSFKKEAGLNVVIAGMAGTLPTATDDALGLDQWLLGPELGFFMVRKWGVLGIIVSHQWDIAGESSFDTSITGGQYIYNFNLKGGWQFFAGPNWSYNHKADSGNAWTLPAGIGLAKTSILKGRAWKFSVQYWNYVKSPDAFGPEHQIRFVVGPVVSLPWKGRQ